MTMKKSPKQHSIKYNRIVFLLVAHVRALKNSLKEIAEKPFSCLMTIIVIGVTLTLPALLYMILHNAQQITQHISSKPTLSIYLKKDSSENKTTQLMLHLKNQPNVSKVTYISPQQGLTEFKQFSEFDTILPLLKTNPLPGVINVTLTHYHNDPAWIKQLLPYLQKQSIVDQAKLDTQWIERMDFVLTMAKRLVLALAVLLGVGVILVVSNTIRLITRSHQSEMQTLKLIGATHRYIRRPFLYHGLLYGCLGGALAWLLASLIYRWLSVPASSLLQTYGTPFSLSGTDLVSGFTILILSMLLGLAGAWLAISRGLNG